MDMERAVLRAISFANKSGHTFARLNDIKKMGNIWHVRIDVSVIGHEYKLVKINDKDGKIIGFTKE